MRGGKDLSLYVLLVHSIVFRYRAVHGSLLERLAALHPVKNRPLLLLVQRLQLLEAVYQVRGDVDVRPSLEMRGLKMALKLSH